MKLSAQQQRKEYLRCAGDFFYFCERYVRIEDADTHQLIPLTFWPAQKKIAQALVDLEWIYMLKARRLGMTEVLVAYTVWKVNFRKRCCVCVLNQDKPYAAKFIDRCRGIFDTLPAFLQRTPTKNNTYQLEFNANGHGSGILAIASTRRAVRSLTADLVIFDEAAYHAYFQTAIKAAQPAVESIGGQIAVLSTSAGPKGEFFDRWNQVLLGKTRFKHFFFDWRARPGRDAAWYKREAAENSDDPLYMKREYPGTPEEAFESSLGRVYQLFTAHGDHAKKFIRQIPVRSDWKHYRGIDFGGVDAFVCLWACVIPGDGAALSIDPACEHTIREMLAYSRDKSGNPEDENNHAPDALRYMVTTAGRDGLRGHVHVYRELYEKNSAARGMSLPDLARRIVLLSGGQEFDATIADRSRPDSIVGLRQMGINAMGYRTLANARNGQIEAGIQRVNALVVATVKGAAAAAWPQTSYPALPDYIRRRGMFG